MIKYLILLVLLTFTSCVTTKRNRSFLGEEYAREALAKAKADTLDIFPLDKKLIDSEDIAIKIAEVILFKIYGQKIIQEERPYEVHLIDDYWIIQGTIPEGYRGGGFEIIMNSQDGRVIRLVHYK